MKRRDESMDPASGWFARMRSDSRSLEDEAAFERWLAQDPANEQRYLELEFLWGDLERFRDEKPIADARRTARVESMRTAGVIRWVARLSGMRMAAVVGACVLGLLALLLVVNPASFSDANYKTAVGERQTLRLADGSEVVLNTDSLLRVRFRPWSREVTLDRGQAYFKVAHSMVRPFDVRAAASRIRAVGTAFDVYVVGDRVKVTLVEGRILVSGSEAVDSTREEAQATRTELVQGESVDVQPGAISPVHVANVQKSTAWLQSRLVFENERLQDALVEVNRYSPVRLMVLDESLADVRISGVFNAGPAQTFIDALQASFAIETKRTPDGTLLLLPAGVRSQGT